MSDSEQKPQRRVTSGTRREVPAEQRRAGGEKSDIAEAQAAHTEDEATIEAKRAIGHEPSSDINVRRLVQLGIVAAVIGVGVSGVLYGMLLFFLSQPPSAQPPSALGLPQPTPPNPRLQTDPVADWDTLHATQEALLSSYGWADQKAGTVHIPIDRAMDELAQRGLPVAPGSTRQFSAQAPNFDSSGGRDPSSAGTAAP